jgi:hypothetical protein
MGILSRRTSPEGRFAAEVLKVVSRATGVADARYEADDFAVVVRRTGDVQPTRMYLSNVFAESRGSPDAERRERIERFVRIMTRERTADDTWAAVRPRLRPVLRPVTYGRVGIKAIPAPLSRPAMPYLSELVVVDSSESMAVVMPTQLDGWGVSAEQVFDAAHANLATIAADSLAQEWPRDRSIVRMVDDGDGYFASLLLSRGWLAAVSERLGSRLLAFAPDNNTLLLCSLDSDAHRLYAMVEEQYRAAPRSLSPVGYVADNDGEVVPYAPPAGHLDHIPATRASAILAASEYADQQRWLAQQYEQARIPMFVATLGVFANDGGAPRTRTAWTDGIPQLLPKSDIISFTRDRSLWGHVCWDDVAAAVDLRPEPLVLPARYRVDDWPPPEILERLRANALN